MRFGLIAAAAGGVAAVVYFLDPRRRQRAQGAVQQVGSAQRQEARDYDAVTLARKVESELYRDAELAEFKGHVSVNATDEGVVELRGQVKRPDQIKAFGDAAAKVGGVQDVHNLLHTAGSPPKHSPVSSPEEVRERAEQAAQVESGYADSAAAASSPSMTPSSPATPPSTSTSPPTTTPPSTGTSPPTTTPPSPGAGEGT